MTLEKCQGILNFDVLVLRAVSTLVHVLHLGHLAGLVERCELSVLLEEDPSFDEPGEPGAGLIARKLRSGDRKDIICVRDKKCKLMDASSWKTRCA